jgi:hypothetical protein
MSLWQKVKHLFKKPNPVEKLLAIQPEHDPVTGRLCKDPNVYSFTRTGSYYLLGVTTTDRDIVCWVGDIEKAKLTYQPPIGLTQIGMSDTVYPETVVKFVENGIMYNLIFVTEVTAYSAWEIASSVTEQLKLTEKADRVLLFSEMRRLAKLVSNQTTFKLTLESAKNEPSI